MYRRSNTHTILHYYVHEWRFMVEGGRWIVLRVEGGRWKVKSGRWKMKVKDGKWKVEDDSAFCPSLPHHLASLWMAFPSAVCPPSAFEPFPSIYRWGRGWQTSFGLKSMDFKCVEVQGCLTFGSYRCLIWDSLDVFSSFVENITVIIPLSSVDVMSDTIFIIALWSLLRWSLVAIINCCIGSLHYFIQIILV